MNTGKVTVRVTADTKDFVEKLNEATRVADQFAEAYARIRKALGVTCPTCGHKYEGDE